MINSTKDKREPWWKRAICYQIYVRSFKDSNEDGIGDLRGIIEKIPYLKDLGVTAIYLNPINKSPNDDNGYDISDYYDIMDEFGTLEDFLSLIDVCHENGLHVIMDLVLNHTSDEHPWFKEAKKNKNSPYHDYYIFKENTRKLPNNWPSFFGGPAWELNEETNEYYLHIFSKKQPDLNFKNETLRQELIKIIEFWKNKGVDGVRLDAINHIAKDENFSDAPILEGGGLDFLVKIQNLDKAHDYIKELRAPFLGSNFLFMGETGGISAHNASSYIDPKNKELDFIFHFDFHSTGIDYKKLENRPLNIVEDIKNKVVPWQNIKNGEGWNPLFYSNHDTTRTISRLTLDNNINIAKTLALLQFTQKGTPFIYYGDEIGMTNGDFKSIYDFRDVAVYNNYKIEVLDGNLSYEDYLKRMKLTNRDNSRTPMQWDTSKHSGFTTSLPWIRVNENYKTLNVVSQSEDENSLLNFYKNIIKLRKDNETLIFGYFKEYYHDNEDIFIYRRFDINNNTDYLVALNFSNKEINIKLHEELLDFKSSTLLISNLYPLSQINNVKINTFIKKAPNEDGTYTLHLKKEESILLKKNLT